MSTQIENQAADEPQSIEHAKQMMDQLRDEITAIKNQLDDPGKRQVMGDMAWSTWKGKAIIAKRHKELALHRLSVWINSKKAEIKPVPGSSLEMGRALKLASKHYGVLMGVLIAAEEYVNSPSESDDDVLFEVLEQSIIKARELIVL